MTLSTILKYITDLVHVFFPGRTGWQPRISQYATWITTHPLILFFVLSSLIFLGISLIRRMIK